MYNVTFSPKAYDDVKRLQKSEPAAFTTTSRDGNFSEKKLRLFLFN